LEEGKTRVPSDHPHLYCSTFISLYRRTNPRSTTGLGRSKGWRKGDKVLKVLLFANDQTMIAGKQKDLQRMTDRLNKANKEYGMKINNKKTKVIKISRVERAEKNMKITIDGEEI